MAIIGIGTDIVTIKRIKRLYRKYPDGFAARILHRNEQKRLRNHQQPVAYLAKRFAAKEAFAKALGTGMAHGVSFKDIEIENNALGRPELVLHGQTLEVAIRQGVERQFVSLSDEKKYAIAYVVLEGSK